MASLWALERAQRVLDDWGDTRHAKMLLLIADALDLAEAYGYCRGYETSQLGFTYERTPTENDDSMADTTG